MKQDVNFAYVFLHLYPILKKNNIKFGYQNVNSKKHGHFKKKLNKITGEKSYEIKIEKHDNDSAKIYTFIHEFTHYYNDHLDSKVITAPQKEWVAHEVAMYFINEYNLTNSLKKSKLSKKWNIDNYSKNWMKNRNLNEKQFIEMNRQKDSTIALIKQYVINTNKFI